MQAHTWTQKDVCFILSLFSHLAVSPPCVNASALFGPVGHDRQVSTYSAPLVHIARPDRGPGGKHQARVAEGSLLFASPTVHFARQARVLLPHRGLFAARILHELPEFEDVLDNGRRCGRDTDVRRMSSS